jgi:hypothetical protein
MNLGPGGKKVKVMKDGWYLDKDGQKVTTLSPIINIAYAMGLFN